MKFKPLPPVPSDLAAVSRAQRAVPVDAAATSDCCARLETHLDLPDREAARTWLTFLRALKLVERTPAGFQRLPTDPTPDHLRTLFVRRIHGAESLLTALRESGGPIDAADAVERLRSATPSRTDSARAADHHRPVDPDRVERLLGWLVLLGLVDRTAEGNVLGAPFEVEETSDDG